jgi:DNA-binding CsgD family transcriptional regulator
VLLAGADEARARDRWFEEACHLHELARLGETRIARLPLIAAERGGLVTLLADHASALAVGDDEALAGVAERFAGIGAHGIASEAMARAAEAAAEAGRRDRARRWRNRWRELASGCDAPISLAPNIAAEPLTTREQEVALMISEGHTSREVADRLRLSVRTVDNHLAHVFTKLGIVSRAELRDAFTSGDADDRTGQSSRSI